jgi:hypothetical protein
MYRCCITDLNNVDPMRRLLSCHDASTCNLCHRFLTHPAQKNVSKDARHISSGEVSISNTEDTLPQMVNHRYTVQGSALIKINTACA